MWRTGLFMTCTRRASIRRNETDECFKGKPVPVPKADRIPEPLAGHSDNRADMTAGCLRRFLERPEALCDVIISAVNASVCELCEACRNRVAAKLGLARNSSRRIGSRGGHSKQ